VIEFEEELMSNGPPPLPTPLEIRKWLHERNRQAADRAHDKSRERFNHVNEAAIKGANLALLMVLLINGGAAIALLTFIRDLPANQKGAVAGTLVWFTWGVATAMLALAFAYFTNYAMAQAEGSKTWQDEPPYVVDGTATASWYWLNGVFHIAAVIFGLGSLILFILGMLSVRSVLRL
jgi:hypothetical protein